MLRLFLAGVAIVICALTAQADPLLDRVREEAAAISPYDHAVTRVYYDNSGKTRQRKARFDPRRPEGERWDLLERNHQPPSDKYAARYQKTEGHLPPDSYARITHYLSGDVTLVASTAYEATYRIERLGPGSILLHGEDISDKISGEAVVDLSGARPLVREVRLEVAESFKPHWLAKIKAGHGRVVFDRLADGTPVMRRQTIRVEGSQPFSDIEYETDILYEDYERVADNNSDSAPVTAHRP